MLEMRNKVLLLVLLFVLLLALLLRPFPVPAVEPSPGPAVQIIPPPMERTEPEAAAKPDPLPEVHIIEDCTVTWYTEATCGKAPDHPAYGITASGLPVEEGVTCAVDEAIIPLGAEVTVLYADGSVGTFRATEIGRAHV